MELNEVRQLSSHAAAEGQERLDTILDEMGIDPHSAAGGYDGILDRIYDLVGDTIEQVNAMLLSAI